MKQCMALIFIFAFVEIESMQPNIPTGAQLRGAVREGDIQGIEKYLLAGGDINAKYCGYPALVTAVLHKQETAFHFLLSKKADASAQDDNGRTVLFLDDCDTKMLKAALEAGSDPNIQDSCGITPLMITIANSAISFHAYRVALLLKYGARRDIANDEGRTAMDYAGSDWNQKVISMDAHRIEKEIARYERTKR